MLRFIAALTVPGLILGLFSVAMAVTQWRVASELHSLEAIIAFSSKIGGAVHELQLERGISAAHLSSESGEFRGRLHRQRKRGHELLAELRVAFQNLKREFHRESIAPLAAHAGAQLDGLVGLRGAVDLREITPEEAIDRYSTVIASLLRFIGEENSLTSDGHLFLALTAYLDVLQLKERAGAERALGATVLGAVGFTPATHARFAGLIASQQAFAERFRAAATPNQRVVLDRQLLSEASAEVERLRAIALESLTTGDTKGVDAVDWFDAATRRIVELKRLEDLVNSDLTKLTERLANEAFARFVVLLLTTLVVFGIGLWVLSYELAIRRRSVDSLADSQAQFNGIAENALDAIITSDQAGRVRFWNRAAERMFGYSSDEMIGQNVDLIVAERLKGAHRTGLRRLVETGEPRITTTMETAAVTKQGDEFEVEISLANWKGVSGITFAAVIRDISERRRAERQLKALVSYDALTGLPNRAFFRQKLEAALASASSDGRAMALFFLDLDHFKQVNDTLGHSVGDKLLCTLSNRLLAGVRMGDCVARPNSAESQLALSRFGGDEFTILLPYLANPQDAAVVATRTLASLSAPIVLDGHDLFTTASIGIAIYPADGDNAETLMRNADTAMYQAKNSGGNGFQFYNASMNVVASRKHQLANTLRKALDRDEFRLYYQPLRAATSGELVGAEALLRWMGPDGSSVSPVEFIPIAEETGLIVPIGEWVLRTASAQAKAWREDGLRPIRLAVNVSVHQLKRSNFVELVASTLQNSGISPANLELEITESAIIEDDDATLAVLTELSDMGVGLALDDFGTGYSSLSRLATFPIHRLKIDRSFISKLVVDRDSVTLVEAILAMARGLGLQVVAEGVETEEQLQFLRERGCDELQGYLFSPPVPAEEFRRFLEEEKPPGEWPEP